MFCPLGMKSLKNWNLFFQSILFYSRSSCIMLKNKINLINQKMYTKSICIDSLGKVFWFEKH